MRILKIAVVVLLPLLHTQSTWACGPFCGRDGFWIGPGEYVNSSPLEELGVLDLILQYRELKGLTNPPIQQWDSNDSDNWPEIEEWRNTVTSAGLPRPGEISHDAKLPERPGQSYYGAYYATNCAPDAFKNASATLRDRLERYGAADHRFKRWIEAQSLLFDSCDGKGDLPTPAETDWEELEKFDRAYQIAATLMYQFRHDEAYAAFAAIAEDKKSPWSSLALYLKARVLKRELTLYQSPPQEQLTKLKEEIIALMQNDRMQQYQETLIDLLSTFSSLIDIREILPYVKELPTELDLSYQLESSPAEKISGGMISTFINASGFGQAGYAIAKPEQISANSDLKSWLSAIRCGDDITDKNQKLNCYTAVRERYLSSQELPWAVAFALRIKPSDELHSEITKKLLAVDPEHPGWRLARTSLAHLAIEKGALAEAKDHIQLLRTSLQAAQESDEGIELLDFMAATSINEQVDSLRKMLLTHFKMQYGPNPEEFYPPDVTSLDEFYRKKAVSPVDLSTFDYFLPPRFLRRLNSLPSNRLGEIAQALPRDGMQHLFISLTFSRALIDNDLKLANKLFSTALSQAILYRCEQANEWLDDEYQGIKEERQLRCDLLKSLAKGYAKLGPNEKALARLFVLSLLSDPRPFISNSELSLPCGPLWWCQQRTTDDRELDVPSKILSRYAKRAGKRWFAEEALRLIALAPNSPLAPAVLNRVIWGSRSACGDDLRSSPIKKAFRLLHTKYRKSKFAPLTPYHWEDEESDITKIIVPLE